MKSVDLLGDDVREILIDQASSQKGSEGGCLCRRLPGAGICSWGTSPCCVGLVNWYKMLYTVWKFKAVQSRKRNTACPSCGCRKLLCCHPLNFYVRLHGNLCDLKQKTTMCRKQTPKTRTGNSASRCSSLSGDVRSNQQFRTRLFAYNIEQDPI